MFERKSGGARHTLRARATTIAAVAGLALLALTGLALAASKTLYVAKNTTLNEKIGVDSKGMTVYALKGETTKHLLCNSKTCLSVWKPYTVSKHAKLTKASGLKGKLTVLHRGRSWQVVIGGDPLYHFTGDKKTGDAGGNGIKAFGGTWHVIKASSGVQFGGY